MNKKMVILVAIVVAVFLLLIGGLLLINSISEEVPDENINISQDAYDDSDDLNLNDVGQAGSSSVTSPDVIAEGGGNANANVSAQDIYESIGGDSYPYGYQDSIMLSNVDQEKAKEIATRFARNFLTYDTASLRANNYKQGWVGDVQICNMNGDLLEAHMMDLWQTNTASYDNVYSHVTDVTADSVYISHGTHDDTVAVALTVIIDENQSQPGDMDWEYVNTNRVHYAVYMSSDLKVLDIRRQDGITLAYNIFGYGDGIVQ